MMVCPYFFKRTPGKVLHHILLSSIFPILSLMVVSADCKIVLSEYIFSCFMENYILDVVIEEG
ncbi:putative membrane protein [Candidatus Ichthyocystis hellenicum]|uniref:Putative membrane protein n=1 Tax=Candidatus Ichthyocystis hellenicum TaxID=1561003 RepID=A0A0S4M2Z0_9BURK|nr:hypothetical protein [Candidatus Ichthyocystis hellenicum]CUT18137.1 putative membrane protein [Candidatus Ichthyocystis hellenicum]